MVKPLNAARIRQLRELVAKRQKSPTEKINSILKRKAMFARKNPAKIEQHSHEMIFANASEKIRTKSGESKKRVLKFKYGAMNDATMTNVGLAPKFSGTRRLIHTHPLIYLQKRLSQMPSPSLADITVLLSLNARSSIIAVPSKRNSSRVAGYLVVKKTGKSVPLVRSIQSKAESFFQANMKNRENPNYWTNLLATLRSKEYELVRKDTQLEDLIGILASKSSALAAISQTEGSKIGALDQQINGARFRYENDQIDQIKFSAELSELKREREEAKSSYAAAKTGILNEMGLMIESFATDFTIMKTNETLIENGFVDEFKKSTIKKPVTENAGFQRIRPVSRVNQKTLFAQEKKRKLVEERLGLHLRLVPAKGFKLVKGQFVNA